MLPQPGLAPNRLRLQGDQRKHKMKGLRRCELSLQLLRLLGLGAQASRYSLTRVAGIEARTAAEKHEPAAMTTAMKMMTAIEFLDIRRSHKSFQEVSDGFDICAFGQACLDSQCMAATEGFGTHLRETK